MEQTFIQPPLPVSHRKAILLTIGAVSLCTAGYFGYTYYKKRKAKKAEQADDETESVATDQPAAAAFHPHAVTRNDSFPLHQGSKGAKVVQLQLALMRSLGKEILGKAGADGDFGSKTASALSKAGYPLSIDESLFNVIVQSAALDAVSIGKALHAAAQAKDYPKFMAELSKLSTKDEYKAAGDVFKTLDLDGVRQTLVNGALNAFTDEKQKLAIRLQFTRMGLSYDGNKWSLEGPDTMTLITTKPTLVWLDHRSALRVPANLVLGKAIRVHGSNIAFMHKGRTFLVRRDHTKSI